MNFIEVLLYLFQYLFKSALTFEPIIYLFTACALVAMVFCLIQSYMKGSYTK